MLLPESLNCWALTNLLLGLRNHENKISSKPGLELQMQETKRNKPIVSCRITQSRCTWTNTGKTSVWPLAATRRFWHCPEISQRRYGYPTLFSPMTKTGKIQRNIVQDIFMIYTGCSHEWWSWWIKKTTSMSSDPEMNNVQDTVCQNRVIYFFQLM